MKIAFIDHYDSFSFNVLDWLQSAAGGRLDIQRILTDDMLSLARLKQSPAPLVISPGPGHPHQYPQTLEVIRHLLPTVPILGVCLGHQMIGAIAGYPIVRAENPWHGKTTTIEIKHPHWFTQSLPERFQAVCYNSLVLDTTAVPSTNWLTLATNPMGEAMMLAHTSLPIVSVQFHPESFASEYGPQLAENFIKNLLR